MIIPFHDSPEFESEPTIETRAKPSRRSWLPALILLAAAGCILWRLVRRS